MAREITQRQRAEANCHQCGMVCHPNEYHPHAACVLYGATHDGAAVRANLNAIGQHARQEALREAAERLGVGDANGLLEAPCLWCGYNGEGYYQAGTHGQSCPWNTIGGCDERLDRLAREGVKG